MLGNYVNDAVRSIVSLGKDTITAEVNMEKAYRAVPVYLQDRPLLGMWLDGGTYLDRLLPFGLYSTLKWFTAVADALL